MSETKSETEITIKLQIDSKSNRLIYAEADKDFVDFIFSLLSLSIGNVVKLLSSDDMVGTIGKVYDSFRDLDDNYIRPNVHKHTLLECSLWLGFRPTILSLMGDNYSVSNPKNNSLPRLGLGSLLSLEDRGFVRSSETYMVMDDLEVKPMSSKLIITMLTKCGVKNVSTIQEKIVSFGIKEGVKLLKSSLETKSVLTEVFLGNKALN